MDWLREVGIAEVPETLEEMYDALHEFRHDDPDGNGILDTYGFCPVIRWSLTFVEVSPNISARSRQAREYRTATMTPKSLCVSAYLGIIK